MPRSFLWVLALGLTSCSEAEGVAPGLRSVLEAGDVELYSLDPIPRLPDEPAKARPTFHGYATLGHFPLSRPERDAALDVLMDGLEKGEPAACFNPRHALVTRTDDRTTTVLICFECGQVLIRRDDGHEDWVVFASTRQAVLDSILSGHGVPLARRLP